MRKDMIKTLNNIRANVEKLNYMINSLETNLDADVEDDMKNHVTYLENCVRNLKETVRNYWA